MKKGYGSTLVLFVLNVLGCAWMASEGNRFGIVLSGFVALALLGLLLAEYVAKTISDYTLTRHE